MEKKRILVVDDQDYMRSLVARLLKSRYDIVTASNGLEALKEIDNNSHVDLVLTDLEMPSMNGYDLYQELNKRYPDMPIGVITGNPNNPLVHEPNQKEVPILAKPFTQPQLESFIDSALNHAAH